MRLLFAALTAVSFGWLAACADEGKVPAKTVPAKDDSRAVKFAALKAKFEEESAALEKKFRAAESEDRAKIRTEAKELYSIAAGKAIALAGEEPKDETALDAALFGLGRLLTFRMPGEEADKAIRILVENHVGSPKLKDVVTLLGQAGESGEKLLKAVAEKATDGETKGLALYALGSGIAERIDEVEDEAKARAMTAEAIDFLERAVMVAGEAKLGEGTIGKAAADDLFGLKNLVVGKPIPDVTGTELKGGVKAKIGSFKGKVVLLDVWATWCGPCKAMIPHEREMVKKLDGKPFQLISVSADGEKKALEEFLEKTPMPWKHWWDGPEGDVIKTLRVKAYPTLYLIDATGVIRKKFLGSPGNDVLDKAVDELVKEIEKK